MPAPLSHYWPALALLTAGIMIAAFGISADAGVTRRVFARFFLNIALPLLLLLGLPLLWLATHVDIEPRILQALVAALVIAGGWLTTAIFAELEKARTKAERMRDFHKAIYAEIRDSLVVLASEGEAVRQSEMLIARMQEDPDFVPFIPLERHDRVFAALIEDIEVLPRQTIDAIVAYYSLLGSIEALATDMRSNRYRCLQQARRILIYTDYAAMRSRAYQLGTYALLLINAYADGGAKSAEALTQRLNSRDADLPGPSRESE